MDVLICDEDIDQFWPDIVIVRVHHINLVDEVAFFKTEHITWIGEIQGTELVVKIPEWRKFELTRAHHHGRTMYACRSGSEECAGDGEHTTVGEDRVRT